MATKFKPKKKCSTCDHYVAVNAGGKVAGHIVKGKRCPGSGK